MKKILFLLILLSASVIIYSQPSNLSVSSIPDELKKNAYAVVRYSSTEFEYKYEKSAVEKHTVHITVLDKKGEGFTYFVFSGDKFRELKNFSGALYDKDGKRLKKFKMSDLYYTELSNSLADGGKHYIFRCDIPSFPCTVHFTYEVNWKNGIFMFPPFSPQEGYNLSVENAYYKLKTPENLKIRTKSLNFPDFTEKVTVEKEMKKSEFSVKNLAAFEFEPYSPSVRNIIPVFFLSPESFIYDGVQGKITDWHSFGAWINGLQKGREKLPDDLKAKLIEMTKNAADDREKVKILYDFLGETTRYVSIQLGIGGFQSMPATEVYKTGFGDCKALSNYLKSMLAAVGISSNYIIIRMDDQMKSLMHDYPSFNEMNHAILQVPLANDTLWLECTNPIVPFGFVHDGISGHDALEVFENGGRLCRLTDYHDSLNVHKNYAEIKLNVDGSAVVKSKKEYHVKLYNYGFVRLKPSEQTDRIRSHITLPNVEMGKLKATENKSTLPSLTVDYEWTTSIYGSKTGNRLFIPVNPFRSTYSWFQKTNRTNDIEITTGFNNIDTLYVVIPEGFEIESIPQSIIEESPYGKYQSNFTADEKGILITQSFYFPAGYYKVDEYSEIKSFFEKINNGYNGKIALRKK